jgi:hypothetical protein
MFSNVLIAVTIAFERYGFGMNRVFAGMVIGRAFPVVIMIWTGGHRSRTAAASFKPSIGPDMSISVKTS